MNLTGKQDQLLKTLHTGNHTHVGVSYCAAKCDPRTLGVLTQLGLVCSTDGGVFLSDSGRNVAKKFATKNQDD